MWLMQLFMGGYGTACICEQTLDTFPKHKHALATA